MNIENNIEAILFLKGELMTIKQLSKLLEKTEEEVGNAVDSLQNRLSDSGIRLIKKDDSVMLATAPEAAKFTQELVKREFDSELSKAALETIAIIVYRGPISRGEIDYVRGVNSSFIIRNLLVKGLAERIVNPKDSRSYLYKPTFQLLQYLGIQDINNLPEFGNFNEKINEFEKDVQKEQAIGDISDNN